MSHGFTRPSTLSFTYLGLGDTPSSFTGDGLKLLRVNAGEAAVEHVALSSINVGGFNNDGTYVPSTRQLTINGVTYDLSANRSWTVSATLADADYGDITVSGVGTVMTIDNLAVTDAKINDVAWGKITGTPTTLAGYGISDAQPLDADLTAIAALTGTSGFLKTDGAGIWSVDTNTYSLTSHTHVLTNVTDVTATVAEVNLLDLAGLTVGWVLAADTISTASWRQLLGSEINNDQGWTSNTGTVTSVGTAGLISGGPITTTGTITTSMNTNRLVGRSTAGVGIMEEINVGTGLTLTGGNLSTTSSAVNFYYSGTFTSQTSINVIHNFGVFPVVQITDVSGAVIIPLSIINNTVNDFTVTFTSATSGTILATVGSPQFAGYIAVNTTYAITTADDTVECTSGTFATTLYTAVGNTGRKVTIKSSSTGIITINTTGGETIDGFTSGTLTLNQYDSITVQSNGSNWIII